TFGLPRNPDIPVIGMVSRLTAQKGFDILEGALDRLLSQNLQVVLLGTGERKYQEPFLKAAARYPEKLAVKIDFNDALAHKVIAGSDIFLMPSRYEPCGLTQMYSLKYGTIPLVRACGGLKDTVEQFDPRTEKGNGFVFSSYEAADLLAAVDRGLAVFSQKQNWQALMKNAIASDFSWTKSARAYLELYRKLAG
ncbi:MAG: glycosyltransferase, partial [Chloroflexota bacterium]